MARNFYFWPCHYKNKWYQLLYYHFTPLKYTTFVGNKKGLGKSVIVEQTDGSLALYGNLKNTSVNVYDYIDKKELIGEVDNYFYLCFKKDGKYLDYKNYIK